MRKERRHGVVAATAAAAATVRYGSGGTEKMAVTAEVVLGLF